MRAHLVKLGVLAALVAAVVAQSAPARELPEAVAAAEHLPVPVSTARVVAADVVPVADVPDPWSFDDADGSMRLVTVAPLGATAVAKRPVAPRTPPKPPTTARSGAMPAAGTPQAVLAAAYVKAASRASKGCHLRPVHLAAIGQVESGSVGGRSIDGDHRVTPAIYGPLLDGGPFAVVHDSDGGAYDGAGDYDRAMGPLQFLPGTWRWAGRDGDGDGRRDPQNVFDAALATADYLCRDGRDLSHRGDLRGAILTYNWSGEYVTAVTQWVSVFSRHGLAALDDVAFRVGSGGRASSMVVATPAKATTAPKDTVTGTPTRKPGTATPPRTPSTTSTPSSTPSSSSSSSPAPAPTSTPAPTGSSVPTPSTTVPTTDPTTTSPPEPAPSTPAPASTTPVPSRSSDRASAPSTR